MIGVALVVVTVGSLVGGTAGLLLAAQRLWVGDRDSLSAGLALAGAACCTVIALLVLALATGELAGGVPPGCYRISTSSGSGTGVGVGPRGGVTVVPIVTSSRTYEPIPCP